MQPTGHFFSYFKSSNPLYALRVTTGPFDRRFAVHIFNTALATSFFIALLASPKPMFKRDLFDLRDLHDAEE